MRMCLFYTYLYLSLILYLDRVFGYSSSIFVNRVNMQIATEVYSSSLTTRVVVPLCGDMTVNRFLLGTASKADMNEVRLCCYYELVDSCSRIQYT